MNKSLLKLFICEAILKKENKILFPKNYVIRTNFFLEKYQQKELTKAVRMYYQTQDLISKMKKIQK